MNAQPSYPLLVVDPKGWLDLQSDSKKGRFSLYGVLNTKRWTGYDSKGVQWRVSPDSFPYPDKWWTRLLARTIWNPRFDAELRWQEAGSYALNDLQNLICELVNRDDDVLTQFVSPKKLKDSVGACETFGELVQTLKKLKIVKPSPSRTPPDQPRNLGVIR